MEERSAPTTEVRLVGGRYRVEAQLGRGGMGTVYRAFDEGTGSRVALKRLHGGARHTHVELFVREYRTLAGLRHPRIVRVFEYGVDEGGPFYTMELLEGADLSGCAPMPWRDACACLRDAASTLGVLHARQLLHRDLSPRNLWRTVDGRLKLLDFGALAPFGPTDVIVGTPPFLAPEALEGAFLDQRADLFALGALGHWMLTGTHAYRAARLHDLPQAWDRAPATASSLARLRADADPDIPAELDRLLQSLLRRHPDERPRTTADVIDHLDAIAGLTPEPRDVIVQGYLDSNIFVGRGRERRQFRKSLQRGRTGQPAALSIEGPEGIGRTRLLRELIVSARVAGATVVSSIAGNRPYETATSLGRGLLTACPREARRAAEPLAPVLSEVSASLGKELGAARSCPPRRSPVEDRARKQAALAEWMLTLCEDRLLVLAVDDLHAADEESQALLAALARAAPGHNLLVLASVCTDSELAESATLRSFRTAADTLSPESLTEAELRAVLRSVFGEVSYLEVLSTALHAISGGAPAHAQAVTRHLVRTGVARYEEGAWVLPAELPPDLPNTRAASAVMELHGLSADERALARVLSLSSHGPLPHRSLLRLSECHPDQGDRALERLIQKNLVKAVDHGLELAHRALREPLRDQIDAAVRTHVHGLLAQEFARRTDDVFYLARSGLHALHAGDLRRGELRLLQASRRILEREYGALRTTAPMFEEALALLRSAGRDLYAQLPLLSVLSLAGFQVHHSYTTRYGEETVDAYQRLLRFDLARRVKPRLGGKLSLLLALMVAGLCARWRHRSLRLGELIEWFSNVMGHLISVPINLLDAPRLRRHAEVLEPLVALGPSYGVAMVERFCLGLALHSEDRPAAAKNTLQCLVTTLDGPAKIRLLPYANRRELSASALSVLGIRLSYALHPQALRAAETLEGLGPMYALMAERIRSLHFAFRGETDRASIHERAVELRGIQLGNTWQSETWVPAILARLTLWTRDAASTMRAASELARLAEQVPTFKPYERAARGWYLVLRGRFREALPLLDMDEEPLARIGWARTRGMLASALNGLGDYQRAKDVCQDALRRMHPNDLEFVTENLNVQTELCVAQAGLGEVEDSKRRLERLSRAHASKGWLIVGHLHDTGLRMALIAGDADTCEHHLARMEDAYRATRMASLLDVVAERRAAIRRRFQPEQKDFAPVSADDAHLVTRLQLILSNDTETQTADALRVVLELSGASSGSLLLPEETRRGVRLGEHEVAEQAVQWALRRLMPCDDEIATVVVSGDELQDYDVCIIADVHYRLVVLAPAGGSTVGALLLGSRSTPPRKPPPAILQILTKCLSDRAAAGAARRPTG